MTDDHRPRTGEPRAPVARSARSKALVLRVAQEVLTEQGVSGVSVDEVARRSGVAKTTIYRHWRTRADLVLDACAQLSAHHAVPDTGSLIGDVTSLLSDMAVVLNTARWTAVLPSIMDAAERDPDLAALHRRIQAGHAAPFRSVIRRAMRTGELPSDTDADALIAALLGPLYYRRWFSGEQLDDPFVRGLIQRVLGRS